ncbi:hypothetical protein CGCSCA1_v013749 [Colletotrichum siamense]|uniref:uncharacterized protein n=1 Tax=Colletotrichum siamense TaxID=690259 RepID=UPI00187244F6|nr:uncharacterized protein CGCS363_v006562 [Colletotrichum siamense]KAF4866396.1 hypothetical protein CGCSCA1_v013749 [Colletotrichum siamense]KAF5500832.1 hypothetical protein CGCS363_v006562 [Colletotrichum siamense]
MSSGLGNFMKNGWHPEKEGTTLKGQVNGLLGRNKEKDRADHVARPLSSLQDPSSFAPPPRRDPRQPIPPPPPRSSATSPGVPPPPYEDNRYAQQQEEEEAPPPQPFRVNTTGLSTSHLPPPPGRKDGADGRTPGQTATRPPPSLPPRLPPRTPSSTSVATAPASPAPPPTSSGGGYLNQNALNRLGSAGVSVPALGIGRPAPPDPPSRSNNSSPAPPPRSGAFSPPSTGQMNELQNRFAKLGKSSGQSASPPPTEGTTMEQKQAALRTASNFHKDPKSVSMADARSAASTFNNFRQRHGEQVAAGVKSANNLNQKYGIADKVGKYAGQASGQQQQQQGGTSSTASTPLSPPPGLVNALGKKKPPPPPPPKKKPQIGGAPQPTPPGDDEPPPIPLATKPTF